ncbi:MAG: hypothetical protein RSA01_05180 [Clostridium sp.]|uniref:hypothetical protein n=1 Tax=Clostridium sp. TaxID=1506 RepID=UPI002FC6F4F0
MYCETNNARALIIIFILCIYYRNECCQNTKYKRGIRIIYCAAKEEARLAHCLKCQSKCISKSAKRIQNNKCYKVNTKDLLKANECTRKKFECIKRKEERIINRINIGMKMICDDCNS